MPLDFSIPLATRGIQFDDPFRTLGEARRMREDREDRQLLNEQRQARLGDLRRKDEEQAELEGIFQEANGDTRAAARILRQRGKFDAANQIESDFNKLEKEENDAIAGHFNTLATVLEKGGAMLGSIKAPTTVKNSGTQFSIGASKPDEPAAITESGGVANSFGAKKGLSIPFDGTPEDAPEWKKAQEAYNAVRPEIVAALNRLSPEMAKLVPEAYDPDAVDGLIQQGRSYEQVYRDRAEAAKNAQPPSNENAQKLDEALIKQYRPFLLTADTPEERDSYITKLEQRGLTGLSADAMRKMSKEELTDWMATGSGGESWQLVKGMQAKIDDKWVDTPLMFNPKTRVAALPNSQAVVEYRETPDKGPAGEKPPKDDPKFPEGVRDWFTQLFDDGLSRAEARARIESALPKIQGDHPKFEVGSIDRWLNGAYGAQGSPASSERKAYNKELAAARAAQKASASSLGGMRPPTPPPPSDMMQRGPAPSPTPLPNQMGPTPSPTPMAAPPPRQMPPMAPQPAPMGAPPPASFGFGGGYAPQPVPTPTPLGTPTVRPEKQPESKKTAAVNAIPGVSARDMEDLRDHFKRHPKAGNASFGVPFTDENGNTTEQRWRRVAAGNDKGKFVRVQ